MIQQNYDGTTEPEGSSLPESIAKLSISFDEDDTQVQVSSSDLKDLETFQRACNYIAASMIFLKQNELLQQPLEKVHIKERLLGHWGTCPGLALVYAHCNLLIKSTNNELDMILVVGPGHGAPAILAALYLEGSLGHFYPEYSLRPEGLKRLISKFSLPGGFPSHINSELPGQIHEGGELGYALSVAYGSVMDKPDLITCCIVGDGEAETGPTAAAWHAHKYIDPKESGAVLPILHCNGFKIAERTIFGAMDNHELTALFTGYGYKVAYVEYKSDEQINKAMYRAMRWGHNEIKTIQKAARTGQPITKPRWPVIILRSPKGWTGPKSLDGKPVEGSWRAHQVPLTAAKTDDEQFSMLNKWLSEYSPKTLFDPENKSNILRSGVANIVPSNVSKRLGMRREVYAGHKPLDLPEWREFLHPKDKQISAMKATGEYLREVIRLNPQSFRIFSPDELSSNKLDAVFEVSHRNFQWDPETANNSGRIIEMLSEHTLQGFLQGYTLTGRVGLFPSYESFLGIITTMMIQYAKFMKMSKETNWRMPIASLNYIETSTLWRQEHNGFSHQNPGFIDSLLGLKPDIVRVYLPPDANCFVCTMAHCLRSKNYINLMIGSKSPMPCWLSPEEAESHCIAGASVWKFASTDGGVDPDVVLVGIGVEVTFEVVAAAAMLKKDLPQLRVRVVNVTDLMILGAPGTHPHALDQSAFISLFTEDKPIVFNFHGNPSSLKSLLFGREYLTSKRVTIQGYIEEGTTTTPFAMLTSNNASRFDVAMNALKDVSRAEVRVGMHEWMANYQHQKNKNDEYILEHGYDQKELTDVPNF